MSADTRCVAAMEYAIVGCVFLLMLFITLQLSIELFMEASLNSTLNVAVREVRIHNGR